MARAFHETFFKCFRFGLQFVRNRTGEADQFGSAAQVFQEPFSGTVWIGRAHAAGKPSLGQDMADVTHVVAWLLPWQPATPKSAARTIEFEVASFEHRPLSLDAMDSSVAMDWVLIKPVGTMRIEDRDITQVPPAFQHVTRPPSANEVAAT